MTAVVNKDAYKDIEQEGKVVVPATYRNIVELTNDLYACFDSDDSPNLLFHAPTETSVELACDSPQCLHILGNLVVDKGERCHVYKVSEEGLEVLYNMEWKDVRVFEHSLVLADENDVVLILNRHRLLEFIVSAIITGVKETYIDDTYVIVLNRHDKLLIYDTYGYLLHEKEVKNSRGMNVYAKHNVLLVLVRTPQHTDITAILPCGEIIDWHNSPYGEVDVVPNGVILKSLKPNGREVMHMKLIVCIDGVVRDFSITDYKKEANYALIRFPDGEWLTLEETE